MNDDNEMRRLMEAVKPLFESASPTLERIAAEADAGPKRSDSSNPKALMPNEEYPAPWEAVVGDRRYQIYEIRSANGRTVVSWLTKDDALAIEQEIEDSMGQYRKAFG